MSLWQQVEIGCEEVVERRIGPLTLWVRRPPEEWHLALHRVLETQVGDPLPPGECALDHATWTRWTAGDEGSAFQLVPLMPDRPIVVRPELPVRISPGGQALFFVSIPVWVRVVVGKARTFALCEEPTVTLSNTWFGDPMSGELCYSLHSRARRLVRDTEVRDHRAVCPVRVANVSMEQLSFERLCIHVGHLSVFDGARQLWTNEVRVTFLGVDEPSQVDYMETAPTVEEARGLLSGPRSPVEHSLLKKSFASFWSFAGA